MTRYAIIQAIVNRTLDSAEMVGRLLRAGAAPIHENVSSREAGIFVRENIDNVNAIFVAAKVGNLAVMEILLSTLDAAAARGTLSLKSASGSTPLHEACSRGDVGIVNALLRKGADVNVINKAHKSPLFIACNSGHADVVNALLDIRGVEFESKKGTLLNVACVNNHIGVVEVLLARGVDANTPNVFKMLPLCHALTHENANLASLLLRNGANADLVMPSLIKTINDPESLPHIRYCLELLHPLTDLPALNVNGKDASGHRLIDKAADYLRRANDAFDRAHDYHYHTPLAVRQQAVRAKETAKEFLVYLRNHGSVEPQNPIGLPRLDLSNERLDGHQPNPVNVVKLIDLMYAKYPLVSEADMDGVIRVFKAKPFDVVNREWAPWDGVFTIPQVIDNIIREMGRNMHDRIVRPVDCKRMIATVIQIVEANPNKIVKHDGIGEMALCDIFTLCLAGLNLCNLGKLINIMACVQDVILDTADAPHAQVSLLDNVETLGQMLHAIEGESPEAIVRYVYDITGSQRPEVWNPYTTKLCGLFNTQLAQRAVTQGNREMLDSTHFNTFNNVLKKLAEWLNPGMPNDPGEDYLHDALQGWVQLMNIGTDMAVSRFFTEKLAQAGGYDALADKCDDLLYTTPLLLYGHFEGVSIQTFMEIIRHLPREQQIGFVELLTEFFTLAPQVEGALTAFTAEVPAGMGIIGEVLDA